MPVQLEAMENLAMRYRNALEAADLTAFSDLLDPDVQWGAPDDPRPECRTREQVLAWYRRARASGARARVSEVVVLGDRVLVGLVVSRNQAAIRGGEAERWQVLTVRDGRVIEIVGFDKRSDALARAEHPPALTTPITWVKPTHALSDELIELRLPDRSDATALHAYASQDDGLDGIWVPLTQGATLEECEALVDDWLAGWDNLDSRQGPALVIAEPDRAQLVGNVGLGDRGHGVVELTYGIAPDRRGHGYATRAARLTAGWLLTDQLASEVELRISQNNTLSQRAAAAAGFRLAGTFRSRVPATSDTFEDLRFVKHGANSAHDPNAMPTPL